MLPKPYAELLACAKASAAQIHAHRAHCKELAVTQLEAETEQIKAVVRLAETINKQLHLRRDILRAEYDLERLTLSPRQDETTAVETALEVVTTDMTDVTLDDIEQDLEPGTMNEESQYAGFVEGLEEDTGPAGPQTQPNFSFRPYSSPRVQLPFSPLSKRTPSPRTPLLSTPLGLTSTPSAASQKQRILEPQSAVQRRRQPKKPAPIPKRTLVPLFSPLTAPFSPARGPAVSTTVSYALPQPTASTGATSAIFSPLTRERSPAKPSPLISAALFSPTTATPLRHLEPFAASAPSGPRSSSPIHALFPSDTSPHHPVVKKEMTDGLANFSGVHKRILTGESDSPRQFKKPNVS
ncbi:hypothetical protein C8R47DRAFT_1078964 [Mycena vitilis]|nr:hypothetical protein C8R47DRAFT_1078964 [Mycena vitilis]